MTRHLTPTIAALTLGAGAAGAATVYEVTLTQLNNSGVFGSGTLLLDGDDLTVSLEITGLEADMVHAQHIHGLSDASGNLDSTTPTLAQDTDGDGFIEVGEGAATYGDVIVPLTSPPGGDTNDFPTAPGGIISFSETYDLTNAATFAAGFDRTDLETLDLREIVIHGMTVDQGVGAGTPGEVNGDGGYLVPLPVAAGEITLVPAPATAGVLLGAPLLWRRRRS